MILPAGVNRSTLVGGALGPNSPKEGGRLVAVSNRVADLAAPQQSGGLAVAVGEALIASGGMWFGWSGEISSEALNERPHAQALGDVQTITIALTPEEHEGFYLGYANRCLWPLLHYRLDLAELRGCAGTTYLT